MEIILDKYLNTYKQQIQVDFRSALKEIKVIALNPQSFTFYTSIAVID